MKLILTLIALAGLSIFLNCIKSLFDDGYVQKAADFLRCGFFLAALILLVLYGAPLCFYGLPPVHYAVIFIFGVSVFTYTAKIVIFGNIILDNVFLAALTVCLAYAAANGIIFFFTTGLTMNLFWTWLILSCVLSFLLRVSWWFILE